jgi:hypothetical protein
MGSSLACQCKHSAPAMASCARHGPGLASAHPRVGEGVGRRVGESVGCAVGLQATLLCQPSYTWVECAGKVSLGTSRTEQSSVKLMVRGSGALWARLTGLQRGCNQTSVGCPCRLVQEATDRDPGIGLGGSGLRKQG